MNGKEIIRTVSIEFANFLTEECYYNIVGYCMYDFDAKETDKNEYQIDELFDYWFENIYLKKHEI